MKSFCPFAVVVGNICTVFNYTQITGRHPNVQVTVRVDQHFDGKKQEF